MKEFFVGKVSTEVEILISHNLPSRLRKRECHYHMDYM